MTTRIGLEGLILIEISQTQKDKYWWYHLYVACKRATVIETQRLGGGVKGGMEDFDQDHKLPVRR